MAEPGSEVNKMEEAPVEEVEEKKGEGEGEGEGEEAAGGDETGPPPASDQEDPTTPLLAEEQGHQEHQGEGVMETEQVDLSPPPPQADPTPKQPPPTQRPHPPPAAAAPTTTSSAAMPTPPEGPQEKKAREFMEQAKKKVQSAESFFGGLFGRAQKLEDAADLYVRGGNTYKVAKRPKEAGRAFKEAAEIHIKLDTKHEAATHLVEAGQVLKKDVPTDAVECYQRAIDIYTDMGRFSLAARYHATCAEIYETELVDYEKAISHYEQAADFFKGEDSVGSANKNLLKVAHMCAMLQQFEKAAQLFEDIGRNALENRLLQYGAKDHFFKAAICIFCQSPMEARSALERYKALHPAFDGTREYKLVSELLNAYEEQDTDKFADLVKDYDSISRIDQWLTTQFLHIKRSMTAEPDIN